MFQRFVGLFMNLQARLMCIEAFFKMPSPPSILGRVTVFQEIRCILRFSLVEPHIKSRTILSIIFLGSIRNFNELHEMIEDVVKGSLSQDSSSCHIEEFCFPTP